MDKQHVIFRDLGVIDYKSAWDYQEKLLKENLEIKSAKASAIAVIPGSNDLGEKEPDTTNYLLFCEHPPVYTIGKSGKMQHLLIREKEMAERGIEFYQTNRGGDITFHGLQQLVGYPILDLEKYTSDIGKYLRNVEEVIILTLAEYGIKGDRSVGETGVWIDPSIPGKARKICAMGVRCSRWITMHGFALNVNTNLDYFNFIIPCGIGNKQVTSMQKELGKEIDLEEVKNVVREKFKMVFDSTLDI